MDLGSRSLDPNGSLSVEESTLVLSGRQVGRGIDRVLVIVDGPREERLLNLSAIGDAFSPSGPGGRLTPGSEEDFLVNLLAEMNATSKSGSELAAAVAVCRGDTIVAASTGMTRVLVVRSSDGAVQPSEDSSEAEGIHPWRTKLTGEDAVVLLSDSIKRTVLDYEIRQSIHGCDSIDGAAWLATLGCNRAQGPSTALVATRNRLDKTTARLGQLEPPSLPARSFAPPIRFVATAIGTIAFLSVAAVLLPSLFAGAQPTGATTYLPPTALRSHTVHGRVILYWRGRPGVSDYLVEVNNYFHDTRTSPFLDLGRSLKPGGPYVWSVRALYGVNNPSGWASAPKPLYVQSRVPVSAPTVVTPLRRLMVSSHALPVVFCWTAQAGVTAFDLKMSGGSLRLRTSLDPSTLARGVENSYCRSQIVPLGDRISWRVGAHFAGAHTKWTDWHKFWTIRRRPAVLAAVPPVATPTVSVQSSTSTSTIPPASLAPPSSTSQAPPPQQPSSVKVCSNPPYC